MGENPRFRDAIERHAERIRRHSEKEHAPDSNVKTPVFEKALSHEEARAISRETAIRKEHRNE